MMKVVKVKAARYMDVFRHYPFQYIKWVALTVVISLVFKILHSSKVEVIVVTTNVAMQPNQTQIPSLTNGTYERIYGHQGFRSSGTIRTTDINEPNPVHPHQFIRVPDRTTTLRASDLQSHHDQPKFHQHPRRKKQGSRSGSDNNSSHRNDTSMTNSQTILWIHVGKTGGETIKQILSIGCQSMANRKRKQSCLKHLPRRKSQLSLHTHGYYHCYKMTVSKQIRQQQLSTASALPITSHFDTYLYTIRHPVDRILSWYNYVHPQHCATFHSLYQNYYQHFQHHSGILHQQRRNLAATNNNIGNTATKISLTTNKTASASVGISCQTVQEMIRVPTGFATTFFFKCFPTIQDWSNALFKLLHRKHNHQETDPSIDEECMQLAQQSIQGKLPNNNKSQIAIHLMANYQHYLNHTVYAHHGRPTDQKKKTIYVVRTEHLWEDLRSIDIKYLHGDGDFDKHSDSAITHGVPIRNRNYDDRMIIIFCCALMEEMEQYIYLIEHAQNLLSSEKQRMIHTAVHYCITGVSDPIARVDNNANTNTTTFWKALLQQQCDLI